MLGADAARVARVRLWLFRRWSVVRGPGRGPALCPCPAALRYVVRAPSSPCGTPRRDLSTVPGLTEAVSHSCLEPRPGAGDRRRRPPPTRNHRHDLAIPYGEARPPVMTGRPDARRPHADPPRGLAPPAAFRRQRLAQGVSGHGHRRAGQPATRIRPSADTDATRRLSWPYTWIRPCMRLRPAYRSRSATAATRGSRTARGR